jgi:hypothetical protein
VIETVGAGMISESSVREKLLRVFRGADSLEEFERWLAHESWSMHLDSSEEAIDLVSSIHLLLSERDDGMLAETELRKELLLLLRNVSAHYKVDEQFNVVPNPVTPRLTAKSSPVSWRRAALQLS